MVFNVKISTIDNYQGEENEIILFSFVRSISEKKNGFLNNSNIECVSFSRAKMRLYIIGNMDCLILGEKNTKNERMRNIYSKIRDLAIKKNIINNDKNMTIIKD